MSNKSQNFEEDMEKRPKRGRPAGKNRVPLSLEERRARNAQYERERRNDTAEALAQLAEAVGCDPNMSNADLLATAITQIQRAATLGSEDNIEDIKRINDNLEAQIASLSSRLGVDAASLEPDDEVDDENHQETRLAFETQNTNGNFETTTIQNHNRKRTSQSSEQQGKRIRIDTQYSDIDSGVESHSPTYYEPQSSKIAYVQENIIQFPFESHAHTESHDYHQEPQNNIQTDSQVQIELQSELYSQLYQTDQGTLWNTDGTPTSYCIANLTQSLISVPSICPPQASPDHTIRSSKLSPKSEAEFVTESNYELNIENGTDVSQDMASSLDLLTENEKGILANLINENFYDSISNEVPVRNTYAFEDCLSGY